MKMQSATPTIKWPQFIATSASTIAIITGFCGLFGWIFHLWMPKELWKYLITIEPNSAVCYILAGICIWLSCEKRGRIASIVIEISSGVILLVGFLTLFEYFFNIDLKIDDLILQKPFGHAANTSILPIGRMTPITAVNFALLGFVLFFLENKIISYRVHQIFLLSIFLISFFEFLLYIYQLFNPITNSIATVSFAQMTITSSVMFIILSIGTLCSHPQRGIMSMIMSKNQGGKLARRLIIPALILPILIGFLGFLKNASNNYEMGYGITLIVLATSIFFTALILINAYVIEKAEILRKQSVQNLKLSQTLALKSANAGTWNWNIKHNVFVLDKHLHHLFGIKVGNFPGFFEALFKYMHSQDRQRIHDEIKESLEKNLEYESEFRVVHSDGSVHNLATRGHIYRDESGAAVSMSGICWDVTHHKQVEKELLHAKEMAEKLAESAEEANRAKSAFLTAMSHEIRTPLNGVLGMLSLLYDTQLTTEQREHIETARLSGEELLIVINDILDFSKIESGRMELEMSDFNLQTLIDDTIETHATQVQHKKLAIGAIIDKDIPEWFTGDASRVRQILSNLLGNAAKFTDKGEISIHVKLSDKNEGIDTLLFEVSDTGIGIAPEVRARLFKPFSQGDISNARRHGGTGLGLVIAKRLVEMMNGTIYVKSYPGKGSKFSFTVKLAECAAPPNEIKQEITPELRNSRILCVDDNAINREIVKRQLEFLELRCDVASNAGEALSMLQKAVDDEDPYAIAIIDCVMPGMDGIELIQVIRQLKEINETNIIILSSIEATYSLEQVKELNVLMSLTKPLRQNKLHESIITALRIINGTEEKIFPPMLSIGKVSGKILLAEDNFVNQQVALGVLNKLGYQVDAVKNGQEALDLFKQNHYDLILMDCQMPEMDGYTATEEIRKIDRSQSKHTIIIALTAHALKGDREKCLKAGMDDYIAKPIDVKTLASMLQRWLIKAENRQPIKKVVLPSPPAAAMSDGEHVIDMRRIHEIFGDDDSAIKQFIKSLVDSTSTLLNEIAVAVQKKDEDLAKDLFHRLKGSCGNSGVMQMQKLGLEAEEKVKQHDWEKVDALYHSLQIVFDKLKIEADSLTH